MLSLVRALFSGMAWHWNDKDKSWQHWDDNDKWWQRRDDKDNWWEHRDDNDWWQSHDQEQQGELLGYRVRQDKQGNTYYNAKRARVLPEGTDPGNRTGRVEPTGIFTSLAKKHGTGDAHSFRIFLRWPVPTSRYAKDDVITQVTLEQNLQHLLHKPDVQIGLPILFFKLYAAHHGMEFSLRGHGAHNDNTALTLKGPENIVKQIYNEFYEYSSERFPSEAIAMPIHPKIHENGGDSDSESEADLPNPPSVETLNEIAEQIKEELAEDDEVAHGLDCTRDFQADWGVASSHSEEESEGTGGCAPELKIEREHPEAEGTGGCAPELKIGMHPLQGCYDWLTSIAVHLKDKVPTMCLKETKEDQHEMLSILQQGWTHQDQAPMFRFTTTCFKRGFQLEAWLYNLCQCYSIRRFCSFTLVLWKSDEEALGLYEKGTKFLGPLIDVGYVSIHMAYDMQYWESPRAKNTATRCASMFDKGFKQHLFGHGGLGSFVINLDFDNVLDIKGLEQAWQTLKGNKNVEILPFQIIRFKGQDGGVTGRIGCFMSNFFAVNGYNEGLYGAGYQDIELLNRMETLIQETFGDELQRGKSVSARCNNTGGKFWMLIKTIKDNSFSLPNAVGATLNDRKSWDKAKIQNCKPEDIAKFNTWGAMDGANKNIAQKGKCAKAPWLWNMKTPTLGCPVMEHELSIRNGERMRQEDAAVNFSLVTWLPRTERSKSAEAKSGATGSRSSTDPPDVSGGCAPASNFGQNTAGPDVSGGCAPASNFGQNTAGHRVTVRIYTFGFRLTFPSFGAISLTMDPQDVITAWKQGTVHDKSASTVAFDCRAFFSAQGLTNHVGTHPHNMSALLQQPDALKKILDATHAALRRCKADTLEILFFCNQGRHRSVAMSRVVRDLLARASSVVGIPSIKDLSQPYWKRNKISCGKCSQCREYKDHGTAGHTVFRGILTWCFENVDWCIISC